MSYFIFQYYEAAFQHFNKNSSDEPPFDAYFEDHPFPYFEDLFQDFDEPSFSVPFALQQKKHSKFLSNTL